MTAQEKECDKSEKLSILNQKYGLKVHQVTLDAINQFLFSVREDMRGFQFVCVLSLAVYVSAVKWTDCGSKTGKVADVQVPGCDGTPDRCILKKGTTVTFTIKFKSAVNTTTLTADVHGYIGGVPLPFESVQKDACTRCGVQCPLISGKTYQYSTDVQIYSYYPSLEVDVKWELQDDSKKDTVCIMIPAKLE